MTYTFREMIKILIFASSAVFALGLVLGHCLGSKELSETNDKVTKLETKVTHLNDRCSVVKSVQQETRKMVKTCHMDLENKFLEAIQKQCLCDYRPPENPKDLSCDAARFHMVAAVKPEEVKKWRQAVYDLCIKGR